MEQDDVLVADDETSAARRAGRLTRRRLAALALLVVACAVVAIVLLDSGHGKTGAPATGVPAGETTATVTRRTLTESATVDGTLGYGTSLELYDRLSGTFTWLPSVGATIARGGTLFRVNNLPVALMYGSVPAYRTLKESVSDGPDVAELNRNLIDLGYDPYGAITDDSSFGEATVAAVRRWQKAEGLPETGEVELGRVIFAPSARRVTDVHVALGQDPPGEVEAENKPHGKPKRADKPTKTEDEPQAADKPKNTDKPKESPSKEGPDDEPSGSPGDSGAGMVVLTTTPTQQLVQLKLKAEQQQLAHIGERAPVLLPGGGEVQGRIIEVGTVASEAKSDEDEKSPSASGSPGEGSGESTIPVTLELARHVPHLDQAPVSVELVKSVRHNVLAVPATALLATAGGGYAIQVLEAGRRVELAVTPGMFADGYVQVEGSELRAGQTVVESE